MMLMMMMGQVELALPRWILLDVRCSVPRQQLSCPGLPASSVFADGIPRWMSIACVGFDHNLVVAVGGQGRSTASAGLAVVRDIEALAALHAHGGE